VTGSASASAWAAWKDGDLQAARTRAEHLAATLPTSDEGHHILALVASVTGRYADAIAQQARIAAGYGRLSELDEPIIWAYVHLRDVEGALAFAEKRHAPATVIKRLRLAVANPFTTQLKGVTAIPFVSDKLTPYMPGMRVTLCGEPAVVRLDTGGAFVHMSAKQATEFGVRTVAAETGFAALVSDKMSYGVAPELRIGDAVLTSVPVTVHHRAFPAAQMLGVELGPIVGTNVLERFLTTIDGPGGRLVLSERGNAAARAEHLDLLGGKARGGAEVPFALWADHFMLVAGRIAGQQTRFFVDSGLVAVTPQQGQANLLASKRMLTSWGASAEKDQVFSNVPGTLCIGDACKDGPTAMPVDDGMWRKFGDWGGAKVDALVSWGFLSRFAWTVDFDRMVYTLSAGFLP
jgi:hypothetical protein